MKVLIVRSKGAGVNRGFGEFARLKAAATLLAGGDDFAIGEAHVVDLAGVRPFIAACLRIPAVRRSIRKRGLNHPLIRATLRKVSLPEDVKPDVVLTTLAPRIAPGALISTMYDCKWIHFGPIPKYWNYLYSCKVLGPNAQDSDKKGHRSIRLGVLPTTARKRPNTNREPGTPLIGTVSIGWTVRELGYRYEEEDFASLVKALHVLSHRYGIQWNITTSPRTSLEAEAYLAKLTTSLSIPVRKVTWYKHNPEKSLVGMLAESDFALITEDSRTMVSDAVATGIPVFAIRPDSVDRIKPGHDAFMNSLQKERRIARVQIGKLTDINIPMEIDNFNVLDQCWSESFLTSVSQLLSHDSRSQ